MEKDHKESKESVENNLTQDYVPKAKLGNLPTQNPLDAEIKKKMEQTKKEIDKFTNEIKKKFKYIEAIGVVPAQASKKIEEEFEVPEEDCKKGLIHVVTVIPEKHFKEIGKIRLEAIQLSKSINDKMWVHIMTPVDIWNLGLDSKFEAMEAISMSMPIFDKGLLAALRVTQIHKSLVLRKFEKYVTSYVVGGSLVRGETVKTSDIDVFIVIDDTDVKRMPRLELKEKLRGIIYSYIAEAEAIAGVKNKLSPQIYLMTDFWEAVKDAHPVMFSFIRDGIPLYDRGAFLPWKSLLRMGKIKPSPEAIDMFMSSGNKLEGTIQKRIFDIATLDLFWGISTPTQGLLMLYGQAPGNVKDTVKAFRETFVIKEKLIEKKYADILEEIMIKVWKAHEHGKLKPGDVDGKELDRLAKNAIDYIKRLKELREQIETRIQEKSIKQIYNDVFGMIGSLLKKKSETAILKEFEEKIIKEGKFPPRFLDSLKLISKTKKDVEKVKKIEKDKDHLTAKQTRDVDQARKLAAEITNALTEYSQRCDFMSMERTRFMLKGRDMAAEVFFLDNLFVVQGAKIQKLIGGKLQKSDSEELKNQLIGHKEKETKIDFKALETLRKIFGEFELVY
jgi:predicted nucleotidyltransferase